MKKINTERILSYSSIMIVLCSIMSNWVSFLKWVLPVGIVILQVFLFIKADIFSNQRKGSPKWKTYRFLIFLASCIYIGIVYSLYFNQDENVHMNQTSLLICFLMVVFGNYAPKIPFNRTLGLRLPWTLHHEATWRYAHRILGWCSLPCAIGYLIGMSFEIKELCTLSLCLWFLIPSMMSYRYDQTRRSKSS